MEQNEIDKLEQDAQETQEQGQTLGFKQSIQEAVLLSEEIGKIEETLKKLNSRLSFLKKKTLADYMSISGQTAFENEGYKFKLGRWISGSWPKDKRKAGEAELYLEERDKSEVVQTQVVVNLEKGDLELARNICQMINHLCIPEIKSSVHAQTLHALARNLLKSDESINLEKLGLQSGLIVNIKKKKNTSRT